MPIINDNDRLKAALSYKANLDVNRRLSISVANQEGKHIGTLICVDRGIASDESVVREITIWRQRFMKYFLTQFEATPERTKAWLERVVIPSVDRIFFLICLPDGDAIGNFGICNLVASSGELDNLIRGKKGGDSQLIYYCELALLSWMFGYLGYEKSSLHVFSNNRPTIKLHTSVGFNISQSIPLTRRTSSGLTEYLINSEEGDAVDFSYLEMELQRETFISLYPWVRNVYADFWR